MADVLSIEERRARIAALAAARKDEASAAERHNADVLLRLRGVPMQPGTPETDADPGNPNVRK